MYCQLVETSPLHLPLNNTAHTVKHELPMLQVHNFRVLYHLNDGDLLSHEQGVYRIRPL